MTLQKRIPERESLTNIILLSPKQPIQDPDPLMNCYLMDGRDAFLTLARDKHFEFSSLRRAQFSTLSMLYELHNQGTDKFVYTCNNCKNHVETRYHCTVCDVSVIIRCNRRHVFGTALTEFSFFLLDRTLIYALDARTKWATNIKWRNSALTWTMVHRLTRSSPIRKKLANNPFNGASNLWCMHANVAMQIAVCRRVKR